MSKKEVAAICTTFNRAKQLYRHIWSVANQDYPVDKLVLIVIDDGSVDNTQDAIKQSFIDFPNLNMMNILTDRKARGHFGGQGIVFNIGLRYAEELGVEYVVFGGGDILWPSYAVSKHLEFHKDPRKIACAMHDQRSLVSDYLTIFGEEPPDPNMSIEELSKIVPDMLVGPRQYFIRPDRESIGNNYEVLADIPDRYDWKPPEKLLSQPKALTLEEFPGDGHIYIGYTGDKPCDVVHPEWPTLESCKLEHWLNIGGWDEGGTGHFWEDEQLRLRLLDYSKYREENNIKPRFISIVHPFVECYHQPHPRQLSHDNRQTFLDNIEDYGWDVNRKQGIDWGRSKHSVIRSRIA